MANPFDDEDGTFYVVVNDAGEHALWPAFSAVPAGWRVATGPGPRAESLDYVEGHWAGMTVQ